MIEFQKTVLIIEDEIALLSAIHDKLAKAGFNVLEARNGEEGLASALAKHPDLILLDIVMPRMDGLTMLGKLREDPWGKEAKIIILTNLSDSAKVAEAITQGTYEYLVKSDWRIDDVLDQVRKLLKE
jgi:DNA-binding response OmpR family regulator